MAHARQSRPGSKTVKTRCKGSQGPVLYDVPCSLGSGVTEKGEKLALDADEYRGISQIRNSGPKSRTMPRALWQS